MLLKKEFLTKSAKKGRVGAVALLCDFSRLGNLPDPLYEHEVGGFTKRPSHFMKVRFRVPKVLLEHLNKHSLEWGSFNNFVTGAGRCASKKNAKSLAALEVLHRLENDLNVPRNGLPKILQEIQEKIKAKEEAFLTHPVDKELPGVSWASLPIDKQFPESTDRRGRIMFHSSLTDTARMAARAITLTSRDELPKVEFHSNHRDHGSSHNWANVQASGRIKGHCGPVSEVFGMDKNQAEGMALEFLGKEIEKKLSRLAYRDLIKDLQQNPKASWGMAKLFVNLPKHRFPEIQSLVTEIQNEIPLQSRLQKPANHHQRTSRTDTTPIPAKDAEKRRQQRLASFRDHQASLSLPVDEVEDQIPYHADVTIVRGGTGSGKTTRYPLMMSLLDNDNSNGVTPKIVVAQPRRLACQAAARRVAFEQNLKIGETGCPIGYSIRFESRPATDPTGRTLDFETPGVILRRATQDPLLSSLTHLVIDEVHERNADMDMLLALAKQAQNERRRRNLTPLKIVLMSATLDTSQWERYFTNENDEVTAESASTSSTTVSRVNIPDARRFPIDIVHAGEAKFPARVIEGNKWLKKGRQQLSGEGLDEAVCASCAHLVLHLLGQKENLGKGSILCFLPGMDEIQTVSRYLKEGGRGKQLPRVLFLHSSVSSEAQAQIFEPGSKIILSTNIAETSITIPDVKIVIDSGRERQFSLLDASTDSRTATVVGSQLATVDISQASAKQRAGRAGRVSAGTCYRLYTKPDVDEFFSPFTQPEMQRMELSQLVLHALSLYHPASGHPLSLLLGAPDRPTHLRLEQTLHAMSQQSLVTARKECKHDSVESIDVELTPLGRAVSGVPASPRIGRMLFMGLLLRAIDPALTIAALLSVPKTFRSKYERYSQNSGNEEDFVCSDVIVQLQAYQAYLELKPKKKEIHPSRRVFEQVSRVRKQLQKAMQDHLPSSVDWDTVNCNKNRLAAQVALICGATPHIAHLASGKGHFATRDVNGSAMIHPGSVNFDFDKRTHWYLYHELRTTKVPYLHVTTAASPLELALFCDNSSPTYDFLKRSKEEWIFVTDQWIPVAVTAFKQRDTFGQLHHALNNRMLNHVAADPKGYVDESRYERLVWNILSSIEQQRIPS